MFTPGPSHQVIVDPFGQALKGYRDAQKDYYDKALKKVQMYNTLERLKLAKSADSRASASHDVNLQIAEERLKNAETINKYLPAHLRDRNAAEGIKLGQARSDAQLSDAQRALDIRDLEETQRLAKAKTQAQINQMNNRGGAGATAPFTPKPRITLTPNQSTAPQSVLPPGFAPPTMRLGGPADVNPFDDPLAVAAQSKPNDELQDARPAKLPNPHSNFNAAGEFKSDEEDDGEFDSSSVWGAP